MDSSLISECQFIDNSTWTVALDSSDLQLPVLMDGGDMYLEDCRFDNRRWQAFLSEYLYPPPFGVFMNVRAHTLVRFFIDPAMSVEKSHFMLKIIRSGGGTKFSELCESVCERVSIVMKGGSSYVS